MAASHRKGKTRIQIEVETQAKEEQALRMRRENHTYAEIALACGWASENAAKAAYKRAVLRHEEDDVEGSRQKEHAKLNMEEEALLEIARGFHLKVDHGKIIYHEVTTVDEVTGETKTVAEPLRDWGPSLAAWKEFRLVCGRRAALGGYDAPMRRILEVITEDKIMAEIARYEAEMDLMAKIEKESVDA